MNVGLHCHLVGRSGSAKGLEDFLDYEKYLTDDVWFAIGMKSLPTGINIATKMI